MEGRIVYVIRDVTERVEAENHRRELERQMIQAQKMESIGRLAGGVAHDFNNILSAILGYSEITMQELPLEHPVNRYLEVVLDSAHRGAAVTRQLLMFSRKEKGEKKTVRVDGLIDDMTKMLDRMIGEDIEIKVRTSGLTRTILADPSQIEQVLMNLVINARDAMPGGGTLTLTATDTFVPARSSGEFDGPDGPDGSDGPEGPCVMFSVADTGQGIPAEFLAKVFEPFFSTKEKGKGTGLGLSIVWRVVRNHGGRVTVESTPGQGTCFTVLLPAASDGGGENSERRLSDILPGGDETILVVEDFPDLRRMVSDLLTNLGYTVLTAEGTGEALERLRTSPVIVDLLITDVVLPDASGFELADRIMEERGPVKVIYTSGYTEDVIQAHGKRQPGTSLLQKPLTPERIAREVRGMLDARPFPDKK